MEAPGHPGAWSSQAFARVLMGCLIGFDLLIIALAGWTLQQAHQRYVRQAEAITENLAQVLEENIRGTVNQIDLGLLAIKDEFERTDIPEAKKQIKAHIEAQLTRVRLLDGVRLADPQGILYQGNNLPTDRQVNVADRDYFQHLKAHPEAGLFISQPNIGRVTGTWGIQVARRLNQRDGGFAGVVFGQITLSQLSQTFKQVDVGSHGSISLRGEDLGLLVRFPASPGSDKLLGDRTVTGDYLRALQTNLSTTHFTARSVVDGSLRTYTMRRMAAPTFYILIGLSQEDYLQSWRREAVLSASAVLGLLALSFGITWLARSAWKRQLASQVERDHLIEKLTHALAEVKNLSGMLPICGHCKKIRDDQGYWNHLEAYISDHSEATFTHGMCPDCAQSFREEMQARKEKPILG